MSDPNFSLAVLGTYKNRAASTGDKYQRYAYYKYLADNGFNYGNLAGRVILDNTVSGVIANGFLALRSSHAAVISLPDYLSTAVGTNLMKLDYAKRVQFNGADLDYETVRNYHAAAFQDISLLTGINCWTAYDPCKILGEQTWPELVNGNLLTSGGVYLQMDFYVLGGSTPWERLFDPKTYQAYQWTRDVGAVVINRAVDLAATGLGQISNQLHLGGLTDGNTVQLGSGEVGVAGATPTTIISAGGAFIELGNSSSDVLETQGGDFIDLVPENTIGSEGNDLVDLTSKDPQQDTTVIFGKGAGHAVLESAVRNYTAPDGTAISAFNPPTTFGASPKPSDGTYKGLNDLHIVLSGLNASDVSFFYKQVGYEWYQHDGRLGSIATVAGYIKINATGETLALPDAD